MVILDSYDITADFWKLNPQLTIPREFQAVKNGEIDLKDEIMSGMIMWGIALVYDFHSKYFNLPLGEREKLVEEEYLECPKFFHRNKKALGKVINRYNHLQKDSEMRFLDLWNTKVDEISALIKKKRTTTSNFDEITSLLLKQEKLMQQKDSIMDRLEKSNEVLGVRGGGILSLIESERI